MRKIIFAILALTAAWVFMSNSSCSKKKKDNKESTEANDPSMQAKMDSIRYAEKEAQGFVQATVVDNSGLDGCRFMLQLQSGKKLQPLSLEEKFMKDGAKVWIKYREQKHAMSVCMAGDVVQVLAIEER